MQPIPSPSGYMAQESRPTKGSTDRARAREFSIETARLLSGSHCENILILGVHGLSDITDFIVVASGTSDRQIKAVAEDVEQLAKSWNLTRFGREQDVSTTWLVIDFVEVIVHLFEPAMREHYDLEMLWGDAVTVDW